MRGINSTLSRGGVSDVISHGNPMSDGTVTASSSPSEILPSGSTPRNIFFLPTQRRKRYVTSACGNFGGISNVSRICKQKARSQESGHSVNQVDALPLTSHLAFPQTQ